MKNKMNCVKARTVLLGRETERFSAMEISAAESHAASCAECSRYFQYNAQLQELLKEKLGHVAIPPALRESLLQKISLPSGKKFKFKRLIRLPKSWFSRVAAVALFMAAGSIAVYLGFLQHRDRASSLLPSLLVQDHIEVQMREHPFDIQTSDKSELEQWFGKRVDFAVSIPTLPGTSLQGGRLCYLLDRRGAFIVFEKESRRISAYILDGSGLDLSSMGTAVVRQNKGFYRTNEKGFNILLWKNNDLIYAFVSSCSPEELETLATNL